MESDRVAAAAVARSVPVVDVKRDEPVVPVGGMVGWDDVVGVGRRTKELGRTSTSARRATARPRGPSSLAASTPGDGGGGWMAGRIGGDARGSMAGRSADGATAKTVRGTRRGGRGPATIVTHGLRAIAMTISRSMTIVTHGLRAIAMTISRSMTIVTHGLRTIAMTISRSLGARHASHLIVHVAPSADSRSSRSRTRVWNQCFETERTRGSKEGRKEGSKEGREEAKKVTGKKNEE